MTIQCELGEYNITEFFLYLQQEISDAGGIL